MATPADLARLARHRRRPHPSIPLAIVHGIHAEQLGGQVFLALAVAVEAGGQTWVGCISHRLHSPVTIVHGPRPVSVGSHEGLLRPVSEMLRELETTLTGLGLVIGELDVRFTVAFGMGRRQLRRARTPIAPDRYHRLRRAAEAALTGECESLRAACHAAALAEGSYFAACHLPGWRYSAELLAPVLAAARAPLVIASDASRSRFTGTMTCAWVSEEGRAASFPAPSRARCIADGEYHALVTAIRQNVSAHPGRRLVVLSDSRPALRRLRTGGTGDAAADRLLCDGVISARWVRGHNGHLLNEIADRLARGLRRSREFRLAVDESARIRAQILEDLWVALHAPTQAPTPTAEYHLAA